MDPQPSAKGRFWRFNVRQLLALSAVLGLLFAILAPRLQSKFRAWKAERDLYTSVAPQMALRYAIAGGQGPQAVRAALEAGAKVSMTMGDGSGLFHSAITHGQCENVEVLLEYGAEVEALDRYNPRSDPQSGAASQMGPPLFAAIDCDQPSDTKLRMIGILLNHGADIRCQVGDVNLMDLAALHGDGAIADLLREHGLPYGPREMAACNRTEELQAAIQKSPELLHQRCKPIGHWSPGYSHMSTLLGIALSKSYRDMARMLIEAGGPLDTREENGQTPLHIAATRGRDGDLIRLLIAHGADINALDDYQNTPLAASRHWTKSEAAQAALIEAGAK
jgi:hypothetical protein